MTNATPRLLQANLYALKRQYGDRISIRRFVQSSANPKTGVPTQTTLTVNVKRAVVMHGVVTREAKSAQPGCGYDVSRRTFVVDYHDLPKGFVPVKTDWIVYQNRHFEIYSIGEYGGVAWTIIGKELLGRSEGTDVNLLGAGDNLQINDGANP